MVGIWILLKPNLFATRLAFFLLIFIEINS